MKRLFLGAVSLLAWVGISLSTLFWASLIAVAYLLHPLLDPKRRVAHRFASWWGRMLLGMAPGCRLETAGLENVPAGRPVVFMANHQSYVDIPALFALPGHFRWMADDGLFNIPVFGWAMRMAGYIPVRRGDARAGVRSLQQARQALASGVSIFIFPEGTRSRTGALGRFQTGGFRLAAQSGVPIVPVVVTGTRRLLPRGTWIFRWGIRVRIELLPAIPATAGRPAPAGRRFLGSGDGAASVDRHGVRPLMGTVRARMWRAYRRNLRSC